MDKSRDGPLLCTIDEKHPRAKGGMRTLSNQVAACKGCNNLKGDMGYQEFITSTLLSDYLAKQERWAAVNRDQRKRRGKVKSNVDGQWTAAMPKPAADLSSAFKVQLGDFFPEEGA